MWAHCNNLATLIVSRQPFSASDIRVLSNSAARLNFNVLARPDQMSTEPVFEDLLSATSIDDLNARAGKCWIDMSPPTHARPFFFNQLRVFNLENLQYFADQYRQRGRSCGPRTSW